MKMRICLVLLLTAALLALSACTQRDLPPDNGTPWPENHSGVYVLGESSLTFDGDGKTVKLDLEKELAGRMGLPAGKSEGTYVFLFHNGSWRYDLAEALRITVGETSVRYVMTPGSTTAAKVGFRLSDGEQIEFVRED